MNNAERFMVDRRVPRWRVMLLLAALLAGCQPEELSGPTFRPVGAERPTDHVIHTPAVEAMTAAYERLPDLVRPTPVASPTEWAYAVGNASRGFSVDASAMPEAADTVSLRHRVLHPNTPLWYRRDMAVDDTLVMAVAADDGAQVFVDGVRRLQFAPNRFVLAPSPEPVNVRIRVLNNAMHGGLNRVTLYPKKAFDRYREDVRRRERLDTLVTKLRRWRRPPPLAVEAVADAVRTDTDQAVEAARATLAHWPMIVAGPYLQQPGPCAMTVVWETDAPSDTAYVAWGEASGAMDRRTEAMRRHGVYAARLDDLDPNTVYRYRVHTGASVSSTYRFSTDREEGPFAFAVWGDSQGGWPVFAQNVQVMRDLPIDFSIGIGDFVSDGSDLHAWHAFFGTLQPLAARVPVHLIPGNHDYDGYYDDLRPRYFEKYARNGERPNYKAWSYGSARFVAIDPNENFPIGLREGSAQHRWFLEELSSEAWQAATWRFVLVHQPPYAQAWQGYHGDEVIRDLIVPHAAEAGIDVVLSGHNHNYERLTRTTDGHTTHYLVVGGGGGALDQAPHSEWPQMDRLVLRHHVGYFEVEGDTLRFEAHATDREKVLDTIRIVRE